MKTTKPQCAGWISIVGWIIVKITLEFSIKTLKSTLYIMLGCEGEKSLSAKGRIQTCPADGPALGGLSKKYIEVSHSFQVKSELLKSWITKLKSSYCCSYILWKISHHFRWPTVFCSSGNPQGFLVAPIPNSLWTHHRYGSFFHHFAYFSQPNHNFSRWKATISWLNSPNPQPSLPPPLLPRHI